MDKIVLNNENAIGVIWFIPDGDFTEGKPLAYSKGYFASTKKLSDNLHLNRKGYNLWGKAVLREIQK